MIITHEWITNELAKIRARKALDQQARKIVFSATSHLTKTIRLASLNKEHSFPL